MIWIPCDLTGVTGLAVFHRIGFQSHPEEKAEDTVICGLDSNMSGHSVVVGYASNLELELLLYNHFVNHLIFHARLLSPFTQQHTILKQIRDR